MPMKFSWFVTISLHTHTGFVQELGTILHQQICKNVVYVS